MQKTVIEPASSPRFKLGPSEYAARVLTTQQLRLEISTGICVKIKHERASPLLSQCDINLSFINSSNAATVRPVVHYHATATSGCDRSHLTHSEALKVHKSNQITYILACSKMIALYTYTLYTATIMWNGPEPRIRQQP